MVPITMWVCGECVLGIQLTKMACQLQRNSFQLFGVISPLLSLLWSTFFPCTELLRSAPKTFDSRLLSRKTISFYSFNFIIKKIRIVSLTNRIPAATSPVEWVMGWVYIKTENGTRSRFITIVENKLRLFSGSSSRMGLHFLLVLFGFRWRENINWMRAISPVLYM